MGECWKRVLGCGGGKGSCGERCGEMCWGVGEVRGDGGVGGDVGKVC